MCPSKIRRSSRLSSKNAARLSQQRGHFHVGIKGTFSRGLNRKKPQFITSFPKSNPNPLQSEKKIRGNLGEIFKTRLNDLGRNMGLLGKTFPFSSFLRSEFFKKINYNEDLRISFFWHLDCFYLQYGDLRNRKVFDFSPEY